LGIAAFDPGSYLLQIRGLGCSRQEQVLASAQLMIGAQGVQFSEYNNAGSGSTPQLHMVGDDLWMTWVDGVEDNKQAWAQRIDGAGQRLETPIRLCDSSEFVVSSSVAFGAEGMFVLYRQGASASVTQPYARFVDYSGSTLWGPVDVDADDWRPGRKHAVTESDGLFYAAWQSEDFNAPDAPSRIWWMRYDPADDSLEGPAIVAADGEGMTEGEIPSNTTVSIVKGQGFSAISFVRRRWNDDAMLMLRKAQYVLVDEAGNADASTYMSSLFDSFIQNEGRLAHMGDKLVAIFSSDDLSRVNDPLTEPVPTMIQGITLNDEGQPSTQPAIIVDDLEPRGDLFVASGSTSDGILAWADLAKSTDDLTGSLQVAAINKDFVIESKSDQRQVPHALVWLGLGSITGQRIGSNLLLTWRDFRNDNAEIFLETLWY